jgi:hypothetical protein
MTIKRAVPGLLLATLVCTIPAFASGRSVMEPVVVFSNVILKLDRQAPANAEGQALLADLIEKEYGTREDELKWAMAHNVGWGGTAALAYIQATTGKTFAEMVQEGARKDFWAYAENAGLSCEKMAYSLDDFLKHAERERDTRIFDKLRAVRRVHPMPDLGTGFGLYQEALDFRHIDIPQPVKIHDVPGDVAKGGQ